MAAGKKRGRLVQKKPVPPLHQLSQVARLGQSTLIHRRAIVPASTASDVVTEWDALRACAARVR